MERLANGVEGGYTIALMCSEADPLRCHRFSMIAVALTEFQVRHILKDKSNLTQGELEVILLKMYAGKLPQETLFNVEERRQSQLHTALRLLNSEVGYSAKTKAPRPGK
jgi:hypothetical protein